MGSVRPNGSHLSGIENKFSHAHSGGPLGVLQSLRQCSS